MQRAHAGVARLALVRIPFLLPRCVSGVRNGAAQNAGRGVSPGELGRSEP